MEISSDYVGRRCAPLELTLNARQTMNFAAAIGDANPQFLDDTRPEGIIAPPMLAVALTWQISRNFASFWRAADFPSEILQQQVHYIEALSWHRPLLPDDRLCIEGEVKAILPHRAGSLLLIEYRAIDPDGAPVFEELIGALLRGVTCADEGRGKQRVPKLRANTSGAPLWEQQLHVGPLAAHLYDGCADIHFPIHTSPAFARFVGLPGRIYHGTATLALALREITAREAGGDARRLQGVRCSFTAPVPLDSSINVQVLDSKPAGKTLEVEFQVLNAEGKKAVRGGTATFNAKGLKHAPKGKDTQ